MNNYTDRPAPFTAVRIITRDAYTNSYYMGNLIGKTGCVIPFDYAVKKYTFAETGLIQVIFREEDMNENALHERRRTWGYLATSLSTENISPEEAYELAEMARKEISTW